MRQTIIHINAVFEAFSKVLTISAFGAISGIVFLQVLFRYFMPVPLPWTEELSRYILIWGSMMGLSLGIKTGAHIGLDFLRDALPPKLRTADQRVILVVSMMLMIMLGMCGLRQGLASRNVLSPAMRISMIWPYLALPIGSLTSILQFLILLLGESSLKSGENLNDI
jgi:C4-dicarboxylate transporter DctQ subunit